MSHAIHQDSEFRATRYASLARPVASSPTAVAQPAVQAPVPLTADAPVRYTQSIASPR